jgi:hypothetical protein
MSQEKKAKIAKLLKDVVPKGWKYSLKVDHYSTIVMNIRSAPVNLLSEYKDDRTYLSVNPYYPENSFSGKRLETFRKILAVLNTDNYDRSEPQCDYFDVGHYVKINIGQWNKPFEVKL